MNIELKDNSHGPVYAQVRHEIESQIQGNQIASGEALIQQRTKEQEQNESD